MYSSVECGKMLLRPLCSYLKAIFSFQMRCIPSAINYSLSGTRTEPWKFHYKEWVQIEVEYNKNTNIHYSLPNCIELFSAQKAEFMIMCTHH